MANFLPKLTEWRAKAKTKKAFAKLIEPATIQKILDEGETKPALKKTQFQFVIVQVNEDDLELMPKRISEVVEILSAKAAVFGGICSSLVVGYFGFPNPEKNGMEKRLELITALQRACGGNVRIAHGQSIGPVGLLGSNKGQLTYGAIIPGFSNILAVLLESSFGEAKEIK